MSKARQKRVLITGGAGFIGSNLADRLASDGHAVRVFDSLARDGVERNLDWLEARHGDRIERRIADVRDADAVRQAAEDVDGVFHFAAQVAVTTSLVDPASDFEVNARGTLNVLEAVRERQTPVVFASTNKVYGDLGDVEWRLVEGRYAPADADLRDHGVDETRPLDFHTPYGCSKGAADQYVLDYARSFGVPACVLRMSCIYGRRQCGTEDQGWVAHFLIKALAGEPIVLFGDGRQVRDILDVRDAVRAYVEAWTHIDAVSGRAFNLGGGPANAVSLRQVIAQIETLIDRRISVQVEDWRPGDQRYFVADARAIRTTLGLAEPIAWTDGLAALAHWLKEEGAAGLARIAA